jgi:uncharacterized protein (TIRG00374 family)
MSANPTLDATALADAPARHRRRLWVHLIVGALLAGVGLFVAVQLAGGLADAWERLRDVDLRWIVLAAACEVASYVCLSWQLRYLAGKRAELPPDAAFRVGLVVYGLGTITPASPAEGMVLATKELQRRGLSRRRAALALGFSEWYSSAALYLLAAVNVGAAALVGDIPDDQRMPLLVIACTVVALLVASALLLRRRAVVERIAVWIGAFRPARSRRSVEERRATGARWHAEAQAIAGTRRDHVVVFALALAAWLADALCLLCALAAAGAVVDADVLLLAYTAGILATEVPLLPGGLGLVETAMPAVLRAFGVTYATALAGAVTYRALGTFLPALAGALTVPTLRIARSRASGSTSTSSSKTRGTLS